MGGGAKEIGPSRAGEDEQRQATHSNVDNDLSDEVIDDFGNLQEGRQIKVPGAEVPVRGVVAMGIFLVTFMVTWMLLWVTAGGIGLALGWILATVAAAGVVLLYARRA
jgi:hypothetical protein